MRPGSPPPNDFGVYDLRYADRGSNLRSKGLDGYTPIGPRLLVARAVDLAALRLRTWVNGELVQDAWPTSAGHALRFRRHRVADLSRLVTLEPGDVILTGTPTGSTVVRPGDEVEVEVSAGNYSSARLRSSSSRRTTRSTRPAPCPRADDAERAAAYGAAHTPGARDAEILAGLREVSTATLASQLRKRGLNGFTLDGLRSTHPHTRMAGCARTVRYLPLREDLAATHAAGMNAQRRAIEEIRPGEVLVIEARGEHTAGDDRRHPRAARPGPGRGRRHHRRRDQGQRGPGAP